MSPTRADHVHTGMRLFQNTDELFLIEQFQFRAYLPFGDG